MAIMKMKPKQKSKKQENSVAKALNGKTTIASGALVQKGDVFNEKILVECKTTEKDFYSLTSKVWAKIKKEALNSNMRMPVMQIDINDSSLSGIERFAVLSLDDFTQLVEDIKFQYTLIINNCSVTSFRVKHLDDCLHSNCAYYGCVYSLEGLDHVVQIEWDDFIDIVCRMEWI